MRGRFSSNFFKVPKAMGGKDECAIWPTSTNTASKFSWNAARKHDEMLELYEWKRSHTVLRRESGSNPADLVDAECLYDWLGGHRKEGSVIAVDGKTIRGNEGKGHKAYHVVSTFAAENQLVLGEIVTDEKSNEITAVPELLASLNIENSIVTADAMNCQKEIVRKIREGGADYVICLKGNQPALPEDISLYFEHFSGELPNFVTRVKDHGRIEKRDYRLLTELSWLTQRTEWSGLQAVGMVTATTMRDSQITADTRYFLTSDTDVEQFACAVRKHWAIENQLHW